MDEFEIEGFYVFTDNEFTGELEQHSIFLKSYEEAKKFAESKHLIENKNRIEILARIVTK
jgi:hypothetical protein